MTARRSAPREADWAEGRDRLPEGRQVHQDPQALLGHQVHQVHRALPDHRDLEDRQVHRDRQAHPGRRVHRAAGEPQGHPDRRPDPLGHPACQAGEEALAGAPEVETPAEGQADVEEW